MFDLDSYECEDCGDLVTLEKNLSGKRFIYCGNCASCRTHYSINRKWKKTPFKDKEKKE